METAATAAPAWGFFSSFLLLAFGTLAAALLGAAHRLGLFYQLMHKVRGRTGVAGRGQSKEWTSVSTVSSYPISQAGRVRFRLIKRLTGREILGSVATVELLPGPWTLPLGRGHRETTAVRHSTLHLALHTPPTPFLKGSQSFSQSGAP